MEVKIKNLKNKLLLSKNLLFINLNNQYVRIYNIENRHNYITTINFSNKIINSNINSLNKNEKVYFINATKFSIWDDMYSNPDFFDNNAKNKLKIPTKEAVRLMIESNFFLNKKIIENSLSRYNGNINKRIGIESLYKRENLSDWWLHQKFNKKNIKKITETSYKYVQVNYLKKFASKYLRNKNVLEIACGQGFYSNIFSKKAKKVEGFDYNSEYIKYAKQNYKSKNLNFYEYDITKFKWDVKKKYDYIFMIDVFLFLFDKKFQKKLYDNRNSILENISNSLNKNGKLVIMDPHNFWLTPRFGECEKPFGLVSEYNNPKFTSIPSLEKRLGVLFKNNLSIIDLKEPLISKTAMKHLSKLDYNFIKEFPQWYVFILKKTINE